MSGDGSGDRTGDDVEHTPYGHHVVVDGRRWRATDTSIPEPLRAELVKELMRARRLVRTRGDEVRPFVQDAKVALGERGEPWWEEPSEAGRRERLAATVRALLRHRDGSTICPSDAARVVGGEQWRDVMPVARDVAADLHEADLVEVRQGGERVDPRDARGPLRIAPGPGLER
jgi:hypothetical protein